MKTAFILSLSLLVLQPAAFSMGKSPDEQVETKHPKAMMSESTEPVAKEWQGYKSQPDFESHSEGSHAKMESKKQEGSHYAKAMKTEGSHHKKEMSSNHYEGSHHEGSH